MKTCQRFALIRSGYQQDIRFLTNHSHRHQGSVSAKVSAKDALRVKQNMARALNRHLTYCRECG